MASAADLALAYLSQGKFAESEPLAREAMEIDRKKQPDDWQGFFAESLLGASLAGQKKYAEAEPLLLEGYQGMVARKNRIEVPNWYYLDRAREWILQLHQAWGKPEKATEFEIQEQGQRSSLIPPLIPNIRAATVRPPEIKLAGRGRSEPEPRPSKRNDRLCVDQEIHRPGP